MPPRIVFVTSVFERIDTGPGVYARYLWEHFKNDPALDFHVVAPEFGCQDKRLVPSAPGVSSRGLYGRLQERAWELALALGPGTIVHGNAAHSMSRFVYYPGPWMVQINDYELAELGGHWMQVLLGSGYRRLLAFAWRRRQESRVLRHVDLALCNSDFTRQAVARGYRIDATRLRTLKKAVDLRHFQSPVPPPGDPMPQRPSGSRLVFVGTDWRRKGLDVLLHCLPAVVACHPLVSLVVVGPVDGVSNEQVRRHAHDLGLESRVHFVGKLAREDIARLFWHSDVAVLPSRREALGVAVLEAMAAGLPVVATRTGGIPEIIEDGECGLLCAPGDPKDLAEKLNRVLASVDLRRSIAEGGRRKVEEFSTLRMVNALRDIYLELAERWLRGVQRDAGQCASRGASVSLL